MHGRHVRYVAANKCLNFCEWVKIAERYEDDPPFFSLLFWFVSFRKGSNPLEKKSFFKKKGQVFDKQTKTEGNHDAQQNNEFNRTVAC